MTDVLKDDIKEKIIAGIPAGRFGRAEEIANAVFFLTSDQASAITGIKLPVDAGYTATKEDNKVNIYGDAE